MNLSPLSSFLSYSPGIRPHTPPPSQASKISMFQPGNPLEAHNLSDPLGILGNSSQYITNTAQKELMEKYFIDGTGISKIIECVSSFIYNSGEITPSLGGGSQDITLFPPKTRLTAILKPKQNGDVYTDKELENICSKILELSGNLTIGTKALFNTPQIMIIAPCNKSSPNQNHGTPRSSNLSHSLSPGSSPAGRGHSVFPSALNTASDSLQGTPAEAPLRTDRDGSPGNVSVLSVTSNALKKSKIACLKEILEYSLTLPPEARKEIIKYICGDKDMRTGAAVSATLQTLIDDIATHTRFGIHRSKPDGVYNLLVVLCLSLGECNLRYDNSDDIYTHVNKTINSLTGGGKEVVEIKFCHRDNFFVDTTFMMLAIKPAGKSYSGGAIFLPLSKPAEYYPTDNKKDFAADNLYPIIKEYLTEIAGNFLEHVNKRNTQAAVSAHARLMQYKKQYEQINAHCTQINLDIDEFFCHNVTDSITAGSLTPTIIADTRGMCELNESFPKDVSELDAIKVKWKDFIQKLRTSTDTKPDTITYFECIYATLTKITDDMMKKNDAYLNRKNFENLIAAQMLEDASNEQDISKKCQILSVILGHSQDITRFFLWSEPPLYAESYCTFRLNGAQNPTVKIDGNKITLTMDIKLLDNDNIVHTAKSIATINMRPDELIKILQHMTSMERQEKDDAPSKKDITFKVELELTRASIITD